MSLSQLPVELLDSIIEQLPDSVSYHLSSLSQTCRRHHQLITPTLYSRDGAFALLWAAGNDRPGTARQCLKFCPRAATISHLSAAAANKNPAVVDVLLKFSQVREDFLAGTWDEDGSTPLGEAALDGCVDSMRSLLAVPGVNVDVLDIIEWSPLEVALWNDNLDCAYLLLQHGARLNASPAKETTCLVAAIKENAPMNLILALLDADADPSTDEGALLAAAERGNLEIVRLLLERGAPVDGIEVENQAYHSPLSAAGELSVSQVDIVKTLLDAGADISKVNGYWKALALHSFAATASVGATRLLLDHGALTMLNSKDTRGRVPLHYAAVADNVEVAKLLIELGATADVSDNTGYTPLHLCKSAAVGKLFIDAGLDVRVVDISKVYRPGYTKEYCEADESFPLLLLEHRPDIGPYEATWEEGQNAAFRAVEKGHEAVLRILLSRGFPTSEMAVSDPNRPSKLLMDEALAATSAMMEIAVQADQSETFKLLIGQAVQRKFKIDYMAFMTDLWSRSYVASRKLNRSSYMASYKVERAVLKHILLSESHPTVETQDFLTSLLHRRPLALDRRTVFDDEDGDLPRDILEIVLAKGFDVNALDSKGQRPLVVACHHPSRHAKRVRILLENGADPNLRNKEPKYPKRFTAFLMAARALNLAALEHLLAYGADVNARTADGFTALMFAAGRYDEDKLDFVKVGKRMRTTSNETARVEVCKFLVASGVDVTAVNNQGNSALDHCVRQNTPLGSRLAKYLVRAGCTMRK